MSPGGESFIPVILAVGGTTRKGSTSELALALASEEARKAGATVVTVAGADLVLPLFDPASRARDEPVRRFLDAVRSAHGILISASAYHGTMPGMLKNALDYIDGSDPAGAYLEGRSVGCIACAGGWQAIGSTLAHLRATIHALRGWPTPLGVAINSSVRVFAEDGRCLDDAVAASLRQMAVQVVEFAQMRQAFSNRHVSQAA